MRALIISADLPIEVVINDVIFAFECNGALLHLSMAIL